jgi:hypothetical protein
MPASTEVLVAGERGSASTAPYPKLGTQGRERRHRMKYSKGLGLVAVAAMAFMVLVVSTASATILEVGGNPKNEKLELSASLSPAPR